MAPGDPYTIVFTRRSRAEFWNLRQRIEELTAQRP